MMYDIRGFETHCEPSVVVKRIVSHPWFEAHCESSVVVKRIVTHPWL